MMPVAFFGQMPSYNGQEGGAGGFEAQKSGTRARVGTRDSAEAQKIKKQSQHF